ncbi:MAG: NUDIX hydrolase [Candidatus Schekmanbacteria bacterium]|nr:NUDIX hydrolase [Candidatus Schekmanbacteria bacterium]
MIYRFCPSCGKPLANVERTGRTRAVCSDDACGFVHWNNPVPVVAALLEHEGAIILVRARDWPQHWYGLVTGFLEAHEAPDQAIVREIKEQLDVDATVVSLIGVYAFPEMNQAIIAYHARAEGAITLSDELAAYRSVPPDKLRPWAMGTGHAVKDWLAARTAAAGR